MNLRFLPLLLVSLVFPGAGGASQADPVATRLRIGGSGAPLGSMQLLAEAFKKSIRKPLSSSPPAWAAAAASRPCGPGRSILP